MSIITRERMLQVLLEAAHLATEPVIVGISGYGGAGKTSFAKELGEFIPDSTVIGVDEYYVIENNFPDSDWGCFERDKFRAEIARRSELPGIKVVIGEGVGIFHPDTVNCFSIRIWVDTDLEVATQRGMKREVLDKGFNLDHVWRDIWKPNEERFEAKHNPKAQAHYFVPN